MLSVHSKNTKTKVAKSQKKHTNQKNSKLTKTEVKICSSKQTIQTRIQNHYQSSFKYYQKPTNSKQLTLKLLSLTLIVIFSHLSFKLQ